MKETYSVKLCKRRYLPKRRLLTKQKFCYDIILTVGIIYIQNGCYEQTITHQFNILYHKSFLLSRENREKYSLNLKIIIMTYITDNLYIRYEFWVILFDQKIIWTPYL